MNFTKSNYKKIIVFILVVAILYTLVLYLPVSAAGSNDGLIKKLEFNGGVLKKEAGPPDLKANYNNSLEDVAYQCLGYIYPDGEHDMLDDSYVLTDEELFDLTKSALELGYDISITQGATFLDAKISLERQFILEIDPTLNLSDGLTLEQLVAVRIALNNYLEPGVDFQIGDSIDTINEEYKIKINYDSDEFAPSWFSYSLKLSSLPDSGLLIKELELPADANVTATLNSGDNYTEFTAKQLMGKTKLEINPGTSNFEIAVENGDGKSNYYDFTIDLQESRSNKMTSFSINGKEADIDQEKGEIRLTVPHNTGLESEKPVIKVTGGAKINILSEENADSPKVYQVIAKDGTVRSYLAYIDKDKSGSDSATGDYNGFLPWLILSIIAVIGLIVAVRKRYNLLVLFLAICLVVPGASAYADSAPLKPIPASLNDQVPQGQVIKAKDPKFSLSVDKTKDYIIETARQGKSSAKEDTVLKLYDKKTGLLLAENDDFKLGSKKSKYSRLKVTLLPGRQYIVKIRNKNSDTGDVNTYLTYSTRDQLYFDKMGYSTDVYSELCYDFEKVGESTGEYNCLAYALGYKDRFLWNWGEPPVLSDVDDELDHYGYKRSPSVTDDCIVGYGTEDAVNHFAKIESGVVTAKLGNMELVRHTDYRAYYPDSEYGGPIAFWIKK